MSRGKPSKAGKRLREGRKPHDPAPRPPDNAPAAVPPRSRYTHVNGQGQPKRVLTAEEATRQAHAKRMVAYRCSQEPEHWHVGRAS
jgi:hypothetical protein